MIYTAKLKLIKMKSNWFKSLAIILIIVALPGTLKSQHQVGITTSEESFVATYGGNVLLTLCGAQFSDFSPLGGDPRSYRVLHGCGTIRKPYSS